MKKFVVLPLIAALALSVTACAKNPSSDNVSDTTLNQTVTDNASANDALDSGNATVANDADLGPTTNTTDLTTNAQ